MTTRRSGGWLVIGGLLIAGPAAAQEPVPAIGAPYYLVWEYPTPNDITLWTLEVNGTTTDITSQVQARAGADGCGVGMMSPCFGIPFPALSTGRHDLIVCAVNVAGEGCSPPFAVVSVNPPGAGPSNVRAVKSSPQP